ncbi:hypothetical protein JR065_18305 [Xanthomonas sp. AmX2]|uniref:hypothetical protein n=1 Tax=Xanthomonas sp. TaxID=29446 RepID=UPI00197D1B31|nr:hypothetical protein [Xanthomonas sp.]MBN6152297.1 hypothetical protein [Xanthomonas sp.]
MGKIRNGTDTANEDQDDLGKRYLLAPLKPTRKGPPEGDALISLLRKEAHGEREAHRPGATAMNPMKRDTMALSAR